MEHRLTFAARLRQLRERSGLTQEQLASRAGLHKMAVAKIETGQREWPRTDTALALARALGITPGELLQGLA